MPCCTTAENDAYAAVESAEQTYNNSFDSLSNLFGTALEIIDNGGDVTEEHFSGFAQVSANNVLPSGEDGNDKPNKQAQDKNIYVVPVYDPLTAWQIITRQRPTLNRYELRITGNSETIILGEVEPNNVLMAPGQLRPTRYNDPKFYLYWSIPEDTQKALETMMSKTDPVTILGFFDDFLAGRGAPEVHFDETTPFVQSMRNHSFILEQRAKILESIAKGKTSKFEKWHSYAGIEGMFKAAQDIGGIKGAWPSILLVGSYKLTIESEVIDINTVRLSYKIENTMSRESATRIPIWGYREDVENKSILGLSNVQEGMLKDKKMILEWQETVTIPR